MKRRDFLQLSGLGIGAAMLPNIPVMGNNVSYEALLNGSMDVAVKKRLADAALNAAKSKGATYTDIRIGRYLNQFVVTREDKVQNIVNTESYGVGVRVIADGCWGFAAVVDAKSEADTARAAEEAVAIAKANAKLMKEPVSLAPQKGFGEVSWKTPIVKNAFEVPIQEKVDLLLGVNDAAIKNGANYVNSILFLVNEQKYFASSDGSYVDQDVHRTWPIFNVTCIDPKSGKFETRNALSAPMGMGYEYLQTNPKDKITGVTTRYNKGYDMLEDAIAAAQQAKAKLSAKSVEAGKYDLVLDPSHLWLTIHESVGHPLELDRVLGYEANFAGTSFATLDKWQSKNFNYGSKEVTLFADKTQVGSLGAVGWDDEGVKTKKWDLVKDGTLVNYQAIRDQAHIIGEKESHGCCYADSWSSVQFQRMANVSLAPGRTPLSVEEMIKDVKKGIYIIGDGSFSIDQQRYNFQFGGQLYYEIKDGKIGEMLKDVAYQSNTQEFWNSCSKICDDRDYRLGGSFFDGKGQPSQSSAVSHGSSTARFDGVNVINTGRKI
ncbi:TldD/PmbA family protein [Lacihabitans soyangensis]|uniref:TldD/PmbA family protein n=1 Tax=Lacihabitans soyangensis TaxID=869394 RepID=A0AAE3H0Q4_9BACT|nr:TldD/PmbA family protein [Lacihabitans soyangensis]MCP9762537.1 TldD/PmbA family protein [Lacihabitans soyangensis]